MMRLEQYPTWTTFDKHSNAPGAGDKIGFNDPTPGRWYILLGSEEFYSRIDITASFTDRYVWSYDGEAIQLFNSEEVAGMSAPKGEKLYFFIDLEDTTTMDLIINTWGGEGDLALFAEAEGIDWGDMFEEGGGPVGRQSGETIQYQSDYDAAEESIEIFFATGRIDITIFANTDIEDISIIASWEEFDNPRPGPGPDPDPDPDPEEIMPCDEYAKEIFVEADLNADGDISKYEFDGDEFEDLDINKDGVLDINEATLELCSCENELQIVFSWYEMDRLSIEELSGIAWKNDFDFFEIDRNNDNFIDYMEMADHADICVSTYDPLDRDGDGTPDDKDDFPDDPTEDTDTDGDGVGDNSDIIASVDNDIIWVSASMLGLILVTVLGYMVVRSKREPEYAWEYQKDGMTEAMLGDAAPPTDSINIPSMEVINIPPAIDLGEPNVEVPEDMKVADLFD